ncbi:hypothetical protein K2173_027892 [Erythroxylum novogranatense]|uniref:Thioredoxin domain-containing protein n=1 Tax=Erythroxylum novogranatense TaxID=1862640 RepID=A0AAV8U2W1_9ROSI|nr:hypothetical protein K2173_027892 [Erythroxylum novogranatense]
MAEEGQVFAIHTIEAWKETLEKGNEAKKLIVVDFTASWCGPCRIIAPIFSDLAKKITNVTFVKVDVDELASVAEEWKVEAMPTFVFLKEGKEIERIVGVKKEELVAKVEKHATDVATA